MIKILNTTPRKYKCTEYIIIMTINGENSEFYLLYLHIYINTTAQQNCTMNAINGTLTFIFSYLNRTVRQYHRMNPIIRMNQCCDRADPLEIEKILTTGTIPEF